MNIGTSHETVLTHYQQDYIGYDNGFGGIVWVLFSLWREVNPARHSHDIPLTTILYSHVVPSSHQVKGRVFTIAPDTL